MSRQAVHRPILRVPHDSPPELAAADNYTTHLDYNFLHTNSIAHFLVASFNYQKRRALTPAKPPITDHHNTLIAAIDPSFDITAIIDSQLDATQFRYRDASN